MRDKQPLIQYWHDVNVPDEIEELFDLVREHNPDMQHMVFDEVSAAAFIEDRFTARELSTFRACAVPAMQSDYFRYCVGHARAGD